MSDFSYRLIRMLGRPIYFVTSRPVVLHRDRVPATGPFILAATHLSPYDVPGLIGATPRNLDFLSVVEMLRNPLVARFFRSMNCAFVDRGRSDPAAAREVTRKLQAGRVVALFPEGNIRTLETSVVTGHPFKPGVVRLAQIAGVPIIPCVILGTGVYSKFFSYLPTRAVRFGVSYGPPIVVPADGIERARGALAQSFKDLYRELNVALERR